MMIEIISYTILGLRRVGLSPRGWPYNRYSLQGDQLTRCDQSAESGRIRTLRGSDG